MNKESANFLRIVLACISSLVMLGACSAILYASSVRAKRVEILFTIVDKGVRSGVRDRKFLVIQTVEEWKDLWRLHKSSTLPEVPVPGIDFGKTKVLAVFSGEKRTGGFGIEIKRVEEDREEGQIIVSFIETQPPRDAFVTQAMTQPYHIVKIKKTGLPAVFNSQEGRNYQGS